MRLNRYAATASILVLASLTSTPGYSWGQKAHQMINRVAIGMVANPEGQAFLEANQKQVILFASTPDTQWKDGPSSAIEKPLHWFEIDGYQTSDFGEGVADMLHRQAEQQMGGQFITKYGKAMWRTSSLFSMLVQALRKHDWNLALQVGGVMGHYVGDMTQPMHTTTDYDGQSIKQPGIHKYYETTLVNKMNEQKLFNELLSVAGERRSNLERAVGNNLEVVELQRLSYGEAEVGFTAMDQILSQFEGGRYDDEWLAADVKPRMARAAALLGKIWDVAFTMSGVRGIPRQDLRVKEPNWIPMQ